jgi:hypothetical protein
MPRVRFDVAPDAIGIKQQGDVRLRHDLVVQEQIPMRVGPLRIARGVLESKFLQQTGLPRSGPRAVTICADHMHANLAGSVTAQHRAVLHQHHPRTVARRRDRGANAGQASADHDKVRRQNAAQAKGRGRGRGTDMRRT